MLTLQLCALMVVALSASGSSKKLIDAYDEIARHLLRTGSDEFKGFYVKDVKGALSHIAAGQSTLKSLDGATHHFSNKFKDT